MEILLRRPAFLGGSRQPAGSLIRGYDGPLADWMEVQGKSAGKGRARAPKPADDVERM